MNIRAHVEHRGEVTEIPNWLWATVGVCLLGMATIIGGWGGYKINVHDERLSDHAQQLGTMAVRMASIEKSQENTSGKLDRIVELLETNRRSQ